MYRKEVKYNRETKDFDMILNGEYVGSRNTYQEAEWALDEMVLDMILHGA